MPLIRNPVFLANLTSPKIEDGIARLLLKSDISKITTKTRLEEVLKVERLLGDGVKIAENVRKACKLSDEAEYGPLGRFFVRLTLRLVDKEKSGTEGVEYGSNAQICKAFIAEISALAGGEITYEDWGHIDGSSPQCKKAEVANKAIEIPVTFDQHASAQWRSTQLGFCVNAVIFEKAVGSQPTNLYKIQSMNESFVELCAACDYTDEGHVIKLEIDQMLNSWSVSKGEPPIKLDMGECRNAALNSDAVKSAVFLAIRKLDGQYDNGDDALVFFRRPDEVRTKRTFDKGELTLVPSCPLQGIVAKQSGIHLGTQSFDKTSAELWMLPPPKPPLDVPMEKIKAGLSLVAFFWVEYTSDKETVNMNEAIIKCDGIRIPVLQNTVHLQKLKKLWRYKAPKDAAVPLQNVISVSKASASEVVVGPAVMVKKVKHVVATKNQQTVGETKDKKATT